MGIEFRYAAFEVRADGDSTMIEGAAMPYGAEADIAGLFTERVEPGAFKGGMGDVILNLQHRRDAPIARTDGGGLVLTDSADRLFARAEIAAYRGDVIDMVKRRILRGYSVEMEVTAEDWPSPDRRIIRAAVLRGLALVDSPAYGDATVAVAKRARESAAPWALIV